MDRRKQMILWTLFIADGLVRIGFGGIIPILPIYAQAHGMSTLMVSMMTSAYLLSNVLFQTPAGHLGDRVGRRPVMLAGTWLYTLAAALFLVDGRGWYYVALRAVEGLGASAFGPTARAYVADLVPPEQRGWAYGMLNAFDTAGLLVGPVVGGLAETVAGPKAPFALCALLGLAAGLPLLLLARHGEPAPASSGTAGGERAERPGPLAIAKILRSPGVWAVVLPLIGFAFLNGFYMVAWSLYMQRLGGTPWQINLSFITFALPAVVLAVPFGRMADRLSRSAFVAAGGIICAGTFLSYGLFPYPNVLIGLGTLDGVASAMFSPAAQAYLADLTPDRIRGRFVGLVGSVGTGATMLFATLTGYLYERASILWLFGIGAGVLVLTCGIAALLMRRFDIARMRAELDV